MNNCAVAALAVSSFVGVAMGQPATNQVRLELRLVAQMGTPSSPASTVVSFDSGGIHPDMFNAVGVARRFEIQYRIVDLDTNDAFVPAGLASGNLRVNATGGTLERAILSRNESRSPIPATPALPPVSQSVNFDPDSNPISGNATIGAYRGLHAPFRGGVPAPRPNNGNIANGVFESGDTVLRGITPLSLAQSDQNDGGWYGLYSVNFIPTALAGRIDIQFVADATTGNRFGFYDDGDPIPVASPVATSDFSQIIVLPSPGAVGLLVLGGVVASRRRIEDCGVEWNSSKLRALVDSHQSE